MSNLQRREVGESVPGKLGFAKVYEDPTFELAAFDAAGGHVLGPSSGGDTALGFLAAGAGQVTAVDVNPTQNHLVELQYAALQALAPIEAWQLLGAKVATGPRRRDLFAQIDADLTVPARAWWQEHPKELAKGPLHAGSTERGIRLVGSMMRWAMTSPKAMNRLLASTDAASQREAFDQGIDTRRWRAGLRAALNPTTCRPLYRQFFDNIDVDSFTESMREGINAAYRDVPIWQNWYLHSLYEGQYRDGVMPTYLLSDPASWGQLVLNDGDLTSALKAVPAQSLRGVWLSNVGEWLPSELFTGLLEAAARATEPGGRVVWSNFVPRDQPLPAVLNDVLVRVDPPAVVDRSIIRYQRVVCEVR